MTGCSFWSSRSPSYRRSFYTTKKRSPHNDPHRSPHHRIGMMEDKVPPTPFALSPDSWCMEMPAPVDRFHAVDGEVYVVLADGRSFPIAALSGQGTPQ